METVNRMMGVNPKDATITKTYMIEENNVPFNE